MAATERKKATRMRRATARGGGGRGNGFFLPTVSRQVSLIFYCLSSPTPARHRAAPSNAPDVGLGALDVEDAEGLGDDGSHS